MDRRVRSCAGHGRRHFRSLPSVVVVASIVCFASAWECLADFKTMAQRLPMESDAIIAINLAKVLETPYAIENKWAENVADAWARKPVMIPPGSIRLLMASGLKADAMESAWELSLVEMKAVPPLETLIAGEGGHLDRVWDRNAVVSPVNAYFVPMENNVLASITPGNRMMVSRWVRAEVKPEGNLRSPYLRGIAAALSEDTHIVMAMDLDGAVSAPKAHQAMVETNVKELEGKNLTGIASALSTLKGVTLFVRVTDKLNARAVVDFTKDVGPLGPVAKPLAIAVLDRVGFPLPDVGNWTFTVKGSQITAEGPMSDTGLRLLVGMIQTPIPAATVAGAGSSTASGASGGAAPPPAAAPLDPAQASLRYYKAVSGMIDNMKLPSSMSAGATTLRQYSKRIEQLPILKVDPLLVEWGTMVSFKMRQAAGVGVMTQSDINSRVAGERSSDYGGYYYDESGNYGSTESWAASNTRERSRSVALAEKAEGQKQIVGLIEDLSTSRAQVRSKMVAKYNIEF